MEFIRFTIEDIDNIVENINKSTPKVYVCDKKCFRKLLDKTLAKQFYWEDIGYYVDTKKLAKDTGLKITKRTPILVDDDGMRNRCKDNTNVKMSDEYIKNWGTTFEYPKGDVLIVGNFDTIISNVVCNNCKNTLPPHSVKRHLDKDDKIHTCPHEDSD